MVLLMKRLLYIEILFFLAWATALGFEFLSNARVKDQEVGSYIRSEPSRLSLLETIKKYKKPLLYTVFSGFTGYYLYTLARKGFSELQVKKKNNDENFLLKKK
jgi:uncharacterized membrane protein YjjB (DUF3815 family)